MLTEADLIDNPNSPLSITSEKTKCKTLQSLSTSASDIESTEMKWTIWDYRLLLSNIKRVIVCCWTPYVNKAFSLMSVQFDKSRAIHVETCKFRSIFYHGQHGPISILTKQFDLHGWVIWNKNLVVWGTLVWSYKQTTVTILGSHIDKYAALHMDDTLNNIFVLYLKVVLDVQS